MTKTIANCRLCHRGFTATTMGDCAYLHKLETYPNRTPNTGRPSMLARIRRHWRNYHPMAYDIQRMT